MALVVCTGVDQALLNTRRMILEVAGHTVVTVTDERSLVEALEEHTFDVAVIGQTVAARIKRKISAIIREHCPAVKVLEIYDNHSGRVLDDADASMMALGEVPKDLADQVDELAKQGKPKH
jgi:vacuolar-type H+-ATPase subunit F/Vma7